jgi:iron complex outermembrane receptor protein
MNKKRFYTLMSLAAATTIFAADSYKLDSIAVTGDAGMNDSMVAGQGVSEPYSPQTYTKKGINTLGKQTNMNVYKVIDMSPSVSYSAVDAFGTNESSYHDPIRIRGKNQSGPGGVLSVEGLPINSNPGGGKTIYDMENFSNIDVYKGYVPVDKGLGFSNLIGKVDLTIDKPKNELGGSLSQTLGSDNMSRTFVRVDTGKVGDVKAFASLSYMEGDKNKGEGNLKRTNGMVGLAYAPNDALKAELFLVQNSDEHNNYYQMTYAEAKNLSRYSGKDFSTSKTSSQYYDYNKQNFDDTAVIANIAYKLTSDSKLSFKPYFLQDKGNYWYASNANVVDWMIDHQLFGATLAYEKSFSNALNMKLGYWAHRQQPPGPPVSQKKYTVSASGLTFAGWAMLAKNNYHDFQSPFVELGGGSGPWSYTAGVRYLNMKLGGLKSYTNGTNGSTSQDYNTAVSNGTLDTWASVNDKYYREWLPSLYASYAATKDVSLYFDYTRSYGYDVNLFPSYVSSRATFIAKGITLQQLWDKQKLEISDNFDIGVKYKNNGIVYNPNIFMTKVKGKQSSVYDPSLGVTYSSNNADAMSYGAELAISGAVTDAVDFMLSGSYNKYYYTDDMRTAVNTTVSTKGNQIPDAPQYMAKAALTYKLGAFNFTPSVKYTDKRYGDVENSQSIPSYTIVDFDASYTKKKLLGAKEGVFRLTMTNLLGQKYISSIITPDNALAASTSSTTYQTGAPFGIYANVNFKF